MKLPFGIEIKKSPDKIEGAATNQKAEKTPRPGKELGGTGTNFINGIVQEEYLPELQGRSGIDIYDEMRRSDGTVRAALMAVKLPIRRANWFIQAGGEDDKDEEIREFVEKSLFEWQSLTFDDFIRQALLSLDFGVMAFEKVFKVKQWEGKDYITWKKFAPRLPKSIYLWQTKNGKDGIQQMLPNGETPSIPIEKLLIFINEMEGDDWWGTSMLRSAYKHWYIKNNFYKIDAIAFERQGVGIPKAKLPEGYSEDDWNRAESILQNMRAHEQAYILEPDNMEIGFAEMKGNQTRDPKDSISHHNREITKGVLAQFLELGATSSGSRALSEDQSDLFLQSVEAVANNIVDVVNKYAIPQLVDLNYSNVERYPEINYNDITKTDVEKIASAYETLARAGGVTPGENDEQYFRELLSLPEREEEEEPDVDQPKKNEPKKNEPEESEEEDEEEELGLSELKKNKKKDLITQDEIEGSIARKVATIKKGEQVNWIRDKIEKTKNSKNEMLREAHDALKSQMNKVQRQKFQENEEFKSWRPLTFAERKIDFKKLEDKIDEVTSEVDKKMRAILDKERRDFMKTLSKAIQDEDLERVEKTAMRAKTKYKQAIKDAMHKSYQFGKGSAAGEMSVKVPSTPKDITRNIDIAAGAIATRHLSELTTEAKLHAAQALAQGESKAETLGNVEKRVKKKADQIVADTADITVAGYVNNGRRTTFQENRDQIHALQRSEVLDRRTCNYCLSVDGRVVELDDTFARNTVFHANCRGIWVEILKDEEQKPEIDGVPKSIRDRFGDAVNNLAQPKKPMTKKNSLARKYLDKNK